MGLQKKWLSWAKQLQAIAQAGIEYSKDKYDIETADAGFFDLDNLPELSVGRNTKSQIEMCFRARKEDIFETMFD
jgi:hypothetical protein